MTYQEYDEIIATIINGNIPRDDIKKMSKLDMLDFIEYAVFKDEDRYKIINVMRIALKR